LTSTAAPTRPPPSPLSVLLSESPLELELASPTPHAVSPPASPASGKAFHPPSSVKAPPAAAEELPEQVREAEAGKSALQRILQEYDFSSAWQKIEVEFKPEEQAPSNVRKRKTKMIAQVMCSASKQSEQPWKL
jgi:hypothetical protein